MKNLSKLVALAICICATSAVLAKDNKSLCEGIGGTWTASPTAANPDRGACTFAIRVNKNSSSLAGDKSITTGDCTQKGGRVTSNGTQCIVDLGALNGKPIAK
jgi:hypothetical protein